MIGGEYKKERYSERLTNAQNQPKNRGYLPGTHLKTSGYGTSTLMGNWSEERADMGYYDNDTVVQPSLRSGWTTSYREMVAPAAIAARQSHTQAPPVVGSITVKNAEASCVREQLSQHTFIEITNATQRAYPAHQPHDDPEWAQTLSSGHESTYHATFMNPERRRQEVKSHVPTVMGGQPSSQATGILLRLRHQLELAQEQMATASASAFPGNVIRTVRRALADACTDKSGDMNVPELREGLAAAGVDASEPECVALVRCFDHKGTRTAPYTAIVDALRGEMNDRRRGVAETVYPHLQTLSPGGVVRLNQLTEWIDVSQLPAVLSGALTEEAARTAFDVQWDAPMPSAHVSLTRFVSYFADASFEIPLDNDFERMMRNAWHCSGGRGSCQNTSCRRVEVVHRNGRITREEIVDDLLIKGTGEEVEQQMRENLEKQGIKDVKTLRVLSPE